MEKKYTTEQTLEKINKQLEDMTSYKQTFIRGLIAGVATAIGATIIAGIAIFIIARIISTLNIPILNELVQNGKIEIDVSGK